MRKGSTAKASLPVEPKPDRYTIEEIQHYHWRHTKEANADQDTTIPQHSTLNDSADLKNSLSHVLLFHGANPRWESEGIIFVKSNLEILPQYQQAKSERVPSKVEPASKPESAEEEMKCRKRQKEDEPPIDIIPKESTPIACFEQGRRSLKFEGFAFAGYFTIKNIALLSPFSKALTRMLEQKWSHEDKRGNAQVAKRRGEDWERSLSYEWAVIKFEKMEGENVPPLPPKIEKLPPRERKAFKEQGPQKSVNELLAEMRLGKDAEGAVHGKAESDKATADMESSSNG
jgi:hypothetical protein